MSRPELLLTIAGSLHFLQIPSTSHLARRLLKIVSTPLGRSLCVLLVLFWSARAAAQVWLRSVWPRNGHGNFWYFTLLAIYVTVALSYLGAALS